jgi:hypothetical protein
MAEQAEASRMTDEVLRGIRGENVDQLSTFDAEFMKETSSFSAHAGRTYINLRAILATSAKPRPCHWFLAGTYMLDATNTLVAAFTGLRSGYPIQAMDLLRRVIETSCAAVYICDHPKVISDPKLTKLSAGKCVSYARKHLPNVGRPYGTFSFFDHPHSAMLTPFSTTDIGGKPKLGYPLGPSPLKERQSLFRFAVLQLLAHAHNVEGVTEMLFFSGLEGEKRFWVPGSDGIEYAPIPEERDCEQQTVLALRRLEPILSQELLRTRSGVVGGGDINSG